MSLIFIGIAIAGVLALLGLSNLLDADDWPWYVRHAAKFLVFLTVVYSGRVVGRRFRA